MASSSKCFNRKCHVNVNEKLTTGMNFINLNKNILKSSFDRPIIALQNNSKQQEVSVSKTSRSRELYFLLFKSNDVYVEKLINKTFKHLI